MESTKKVGTGRDTLIRGQLRYTGYTAQVLIGVHGDRSLLRRTVCVADVLLLTQISLSNTGSFAKSTMCG